SGLPYILGWRRARVYHGVWGAAPFQSLYEPAPTLLASLPQMPEWHLMTAMLAGIAALGVVWSPLRLALPLLVAAILPPIAQACLGGARARFPDAPRGMARRAGWALGPGSARRLLRGGPPPHGRRRARGWEAAHPRALVAGHARRRPAPHAGVRRADGRLARRSSLGCRRGARFRRAPVRGARGRAVQRRDGHDPGDRRAAAP